MSVLQIFAHRALGSLALYGVIAFPCVWFIGLSYLLGFTYGPEQVVAVWLLSFTLPALLVVDVVLTAGSVWRGKNGR